jgi:3-phosphoshikimate 1-carboxyvinyltransferase
MMGAQIWGRAGDFLPMSIMGQRLRPIHYTMKVASAQVKSAIIFASLFTEGESFIEEPLSSRDHTERMLSFFGAKIKREDGKIRVKGPFSLKGEFFYQVPFDISAAAFFIVAATLLEGSCIYIRDVCINPTRIGFLKTLSRMGAKIKIKRKRALFNEDIADIHVEHSHLKGVDIKAEQVPLQIDEIPILCIAASMAEGVTCIRGAKELRYKETDRIKAMTEGLRKCGVKVKELEDGLIIEGRRSIKGASFFSFGDHRIAMAFCIASLVADGESVIKDTSCISTSFPEFESSLNECVRW